MNDSVKAARALAVAEDNAADIARLRAEMSDRCNVAELSGTEAGGVTTFGRVTARGAFLAAVVFDGAPTTATFCGDALGVSSSSPIIAVGGKGTGELALGGVRAGARAIVVGATPIK